MGTKKGDCSEMKKLLILIDLSGIREISYSFMLLNIESEKEGYLTLRTCFFHSGKVIPVLEKIARFKEFNDPNPQQSDNISLVYSGFLRSTLSNSTIR